MARYYFDVHDGEITIDPEGAELPDDAAAIANGVMEARALAAEDVRRGQLVGSHRIVVMDANRQPIGSIRFDEAVDIRLEDAEGG